MNFDLYASYYDLLYADKDYAAEAHYVIKRLNAYGDSPYVILELGCGSGAHAVHLCATGLEVTGIERSESMVQKARSKGIERFTALKGDITDFNLVRQFDAVIALFHVISYLTTNDELLACFRKAHSHLRANGLFLFDVWYTPAVNHLRPEKRTKLLSDESIEVTRHANPLIFDQINVVEVNYDIAVREKSTGNLETFKESHPMRHFSIPEMELIAMQTGFELVVVEEFLTGSKPTSNTWGVYFLMKKKSHEQ
jgi:SAM-dependent methyltransferase